MTNSITAVFEAGMLRPLQAIELKEGEQVELIVVTHPPRGSKTPAQIVSEIASLPVEGDGDRFTSRDHDTYLYGKDAP